MTTDDTRRLAMCDAAMERERQSTIYSSDSVFAAGHLAAELRQCIAEKQAALDRIAELERPAQIRKAGPRCYAEWLEKHG